MAECLAERHDTAKWADWYPTGAIIGQGRNAHAALAHMARILFVGVGFHAVTSSRGYEGRRRHPEQGPWTHLREEKGTPNQCPPFWGSVNGPSREGAAERG